MVLIHQAAAGQTSANQKPDGRQIVSGPLNARRSAPSNAAAMLPGVSLYHLYRRSVSEVRTNLRSVFPVILFAGFMCSCVSAQKFREGQQEASTLRARNVELAGYAEMLRSQNETLVYSNDLLRNEFNSYRTDCENSRQARTYRGGALGLQEDFRYTDQNDFDVLNIAKIWSQYSVVASDTKEERNNNLEDRTRLNTLITTLSQSSRER